MKGKIKKLSKKWCAAFLALCMVLSLAMQYGPLASFAKDANPTPEELGFKRATITEFGLDYQAYSDSTAGKAYTGGSFNNKYLDVDLVMPETGSATLVYAANGLYGGYRIYTQDGNLVVQLATPDSKNYYSPEELGIDKITDRFNFKFAVAYGDGYGVETAYQSTYYLWVNDILIDQVSCDVAQTMGTEAHILGGTAITFREPSEKKTPEEMGFSRVSIKDVGLNYISYTQNINGTTYTGDDLNNKYLDVDVTMAATSSAYLVYAADGLWTGYRINVDGNGNLAVWCSEGTKTYTPQELGLKKITDKFNLKFGTTFGSGFGSGACDVAYTLWVNDKFIDTVSYEAVTGMGNQAHTIAGNAIKFSEPVEQNTPEYYGFSRVTIDEIGHTYGSYASYSTNAAYSGGSLNNKYLDVNLQATAENSAILTFAATGTWTGFRIYVDNSELVVQGVYDEGYDSSSKTYSVDELGIDNITDKFNLKFGVRFPENYKDGDCESTYMLWINNVLIDKYTFAKVAAGDTMNFLAGTELIVSENLIQKTPESYGFSRVTIDEIGHTYGSYASYSTNAAYSGGSLNNKYLDVNLQATGTNSTTLTYAASGTYTGFRICVRDDEFVIDGIYNGGWNRDTKKYTVDELGLDNITDKFNFKFGVSFPENYQDGECEATYMMWINDILIDKYTFPRVLVGDTMSFMNDGGTDALVVSENFIQNTPEELGLSRVEVTNMGLDYIPYSYNVAGSTYNGDNLNSKYLDVDMTMAEMSSANLVYAATGLWDGYRIYVNEDKNLVIDQAYGNAGSSHSKSYTAKDLGLNAITDKFNLKFGTIFGEGFGSGDCDATYVLWINDVLIDKVTYIGAIGMGNQAHILGGATITLSRPYTSPEEMGLSRVTLDQVGLSYLSYGGVNIAGGTYTGDNLNNKYLDVDVTMEEASSAYLVYAADGLYSGYRIYVNSSGNLEIWCAAGSKEYTASQLGLSRITDRFNLKFGTTFGNGFGSGTCDATYTLWVNDVLIDRVAYQGVSGMSNQAHVIAGNAIQFSRTLPKAVIQKTPEEMGYTSITLNDFGLADGIYQCESGDYKLAVGNSSVGSLDKKYLNVDVSFDAVGDNTFIRYANNNQWEGLMVSVKKEAFYVESDHYTLKQLGLTSLAETFNMKLAVDFGEGYGTASCDVVYSLWINDVLIAENVEVKSVANTGEKLTICTLPSGETITVASAGNLTTKMQSAVSYDLDEGDYLLTGTKVTVNEKEKETGTTLNIPGDYTVVREQNFVQYVQTVSLYKLGDVDLNGTAGEASDYTALEEMLSTVKQEYKATKAAEYAADLDNDGNVGFKDLALLKSVTEGTTMQSIKDKYHVPAITYDYLGGDDVMPIVGFNGPYVGENDLLTDEVMKLIKDSGVNMISSTNHSMGQNNGHALKAIKEAEKYGLGFYMRDFDLNAEIDLLYGTKTEGATLTDEEFMSYLNRYASYENFLGINVIDEPTPNSDSFTSDDLINRQLKYYDGLGSRLNAFTNLAGYVNLYPSWAPQATTGTTYSNYVSTVKNQMNAKMLSVDHYPFNIEAGIDNAYMYFKSLWTVSQTASTTIPWWGTVQAGGDFRDNESAEATNNDFLPTKAETFWNVNTILAFGAKGVQWFPLVQPEGFANDNSDDGKDYDRNGVVGADAQKTPFYDYAKEINKHIAAIDEVLMKAQNTGIMWTGTNASYNLQRAGVTQTGSTDMLKNIHATSGDGAIVGCFDYRDTEAFYVVNYDIEKSETVTLTFANNYKYKIVQNAVATYGSTTNKECVINLAAGEGVLVVVEDTVQTYSADEYATYRSATGNKAPDAEPGYIFSGWFKDADCKTAITTDTITGTAYAKFVSEDVLTVKAQIKAGTNASSASSDIRFVTTVDGLDYKSVGFDVTLGGRYKKTVTSNNVYHTLFYVGSNSQVDNEYKPYKEFSTASTHFFAYTFRNMPTKSFGAKFVVTPYWVTLDGTTVYGETAVKCVNMGIGK